MIEKYNIKLIDFEVLQKVHILEMKKLKESKLSLEESDTGRWTLLDFGDVVIHLFSPEGRDFYNLEDVWGDAPRLDWKDANLKIN